MLEAGPPLAHRNKRGLYWLYTVLGWASILLFLACGWEGLQTIIDDEATFNLCLGFGVASGLAWFFFRHLSRHYRQQSGQPD